MLAAMWLLAERGALKRSFSSMVVAIPALLIGGRVASACSIVIDQVVQGSDVDVAAAFARGGSVYWGGLMGYLLALALVCRVRRVPLRPVLDVAAVVIPLFHAVARTGCFCAGCCYGVESELFGIPYQTAPGEPWVERIPVQLIEAACEGVLFVVLLMRYRREVTGSPQGLTGDACATSALQGDGHARSELCDDPRTSVPLIEQYLGAYACVRFVLEFVRGDAIRGVYGGFSFSQYVAMLVLVAFGIAWALRRRCGLVHRGAELARRAP